MRRCSRCLLVGVLVFSLSVDAARACGHLRRYRQPVPCRPAPVVVVQWSTVCDPCGCVAACDGGWCAPAGLPVASGVVAGCEQIACGTPLDGCAEVVAAPAVTSGVVESPTIESAPAAPAEASVVAPEPVEPQPSPVVSAVPELEPVAPASATEPAARGEQGLTIPGDVAEQPPAPAPEEPVIPAPVVPSPVAVEPAPAAPPQPRNIFEEADDAGAEEQPAIDEPAAAEQPAAGIPGDAVPFEPAVVPAPADEPAIETPAIEPPVDDLPAIEPEIPADPAPEPAAAAEPLRRWIDDTAAYAVVGRLVDVRGDAVEILRTDGRSVVVRLDRLSGFDREYVAHAAVRLAARRPAPPAVDTASR